MDYEEDCWIKLFFIPNELETQRLRSTQTQFTQNKLIFYSETLNNEYIERIHQMSYSSLSDKGMLQIFSFLIK